ncbi:hypothetical protein Psch_01455 [Pelotomaculum schinkii]|uniref:Methyltransferase domain-containing protein n=1 Tax=Pelotomaculum schinkii TaxID=78350 RepID=A0A4Y7RGM7_9FIRM|nr:class I SAM-dependent methyltransferase [Pelotomaculum schinkii]TEB07900.1 hypothetical protein Psch_01455 [Pelotomaculum schinkii]
MDISQGMIDRAAAKFAHPRINLICADIEEVDFTDPFEIIMI